MTIEQLWQEMEAESEANVAWLTRFARPEAGYPLLVALEKTTRARTLLVPVSKAVLPPRREWPECRGLEMISVSLGLQAHLGVRLRDPRCADVFTALAEDVASHVARATKPKQAVAEILGRLRRWQQFLKLSRELMSVEQQRGLWGELHVLRAHLFPAFGVSEAVGAWKASAAAHQDFQFPNGAIEIKTTSAKQPQGVRITSERQLDDTGVGALFLHVVVVDEREVPEGSACTGASLPGLIAEIRSILSSDTHALADFDDRMLDRGWLDAHAPRYEGRRWAVRNERTYKVGRKFPRLVEADLPSGVGEVSFSLNLIACKPFTIQIPVMLDTFKMSKSMKIKRRTNC